MAELLMRSCAHCGKESDRKPSTCRDGTLSTRVFCDRRCYDGSRSQIIQDRIKPCPGCSKPVGGPSSVSKWCSRECRFLHRKAKPTNCLNCGCLFTGVTWHPSKGRYVSNSSRTVCSHLCLREWISRNEVRKAKISAAFAGSKHPNWRGGDRTRSGRGQGWPRIAESVRKRDGYKCVDCGIADVDCKDRFGRRLDVDHEVPFHNFPNARAANRRSNLKARCASCHRKAEAKRETQSVLPFLRPQPKPKQMGEGHSQAKLTNVLVLEMRKRHRSGEGLTKLASRFGVSIGCASAVLKGITWRHLPI